MAPSATLPAPTHRHRSKSAVRGRSPDPKALKKANEKAKKQRKQDKKMKEVADAFVTPPPKVRNQSPGAPSTTPKTEVKRKISFAKENTVVPIEAENPAPSKEMGSQEADKILNDMKNTNNKDCTECSQMCLLHFPVITYYSLFSFRLAGRDEKEEESRDQRSCRRH